MAGEDESGALQLELRKVATGTIGSEIGHSQLTPAIEFEPKRQVFTAQVADIPSGKKEPIVVSDPEVLFEQVGFGLGNVS